MKLSSKTIEYVQSNNIDVDSDDILSKNIESINEVMELYNDIVELDPNEPSLEGLKDQFLESDEGTLKFVKELFPETKAPAPSKDKAASKKANVDDENLNKLVEVEKGLFLDKNTQKEAWEYTKKEIVKFPRDHSKKKYGNEWYYTWWLNLSPSLRENTNKRATLYSKYLNLSETIPKAATDEVFKDYILLAHKSEVKDAIQEGKNVPKKVLADYPDLVGYTKNNASSKKAKPETPPLLTADGKRRIDDEALEALDKYVGGLEQTKTKHTKDGKYTKTRQALHEKIIREELEGKSCIQRDKPIAILTGGTPGSGKSTFIRNNVEWMQDDRIFTVDADEVRAKLPEYKGWNASQTVLETKDIMAQLLKEIGKDGCKYDVILDGTMKNKTKYNDWVKMLEKNGYEVFLLYIDVPTEIAMERAMKRYESKGRYVPKWLIQEDGDVGLEVFNDIKNKVAGYWLVDGMKNEIIESSGNFPKDRNYDELTNANLEVKKMLDDPAPATKTTNKLTKFKEGQTVYLDGKKAEIIGVNKKSYRVLVEGEGADNYKEEELSLEKPTEAIFKKGDLVKVKKTYLAQHPVLKQLNKAKVLKHVRFSNEKNSWMVDVEILQDKSKTYFYESELDIYKASDTKAVNKNKKIQIKNIKLIWTEGLLDEKYENTNYNTWEGFQKAINDIWNSEKESLKKGGYNKVKVELNWKSGPHVIYRIDLGYDDGDYNPDKKSVGEYFLEITENEGYDWGLSSKNKTDKSESTTTFKPELTYLKKAPQDLIDQGETVRFCQAFTVIKAEKEMIVDFKTSVNKGDYLVLNDKGYPFTTLTPKSFEKRCELGAPSKDNSKYSRYFYRGIFGDFDGDGIQNVDDPNPYQKGDVKTVEEVKLSDEIAAIIDFRKDFEEVREKFIKKLAKVADNETDILSRTKTPFSIINKTRRKLVKSGGGKITDIVGAMVVFKDQFHLDNFKDEVQAGALGKIIEFDDYYKKPKGGYRAYHWNLVFEGQVVELQAKTKRQKAITKQSHTLYKIGMLNDKKMGEVTALAFEADKGDKNARIKIDKILSDPKALNMALANLSPSKENPNSEVKEIITDAKTDGKPTPETPKAEHEALKENTVSKATHEKAKARILELGAEKIKAEKAAKIDVNPAPKAAKEITPVVSVPQASSNSPEPKPEKPTAKNCDIKRFTGDLPSALRIRYDGMIEGFKLGKEKRRIMQVLFQEEKGKILFKIKHYDPLMKRVKFLGKWAAGMGNPEYFYVCKDSGRFTKTERPKQGTYKVLYNEQQVNADYRDNRSWSSCNSMISKAYQLCKEGDCSAEEKKKMEAIIGKCQSVDMLRKENIRYLRWLHQKTSERRKKGEDYYVAFRRVMKELRAA